MRFWDTSALVPSLLEEDHTATVIGLMKEDPRLLVWWGTRAECVSAIRRQEREGLGATEAGQALESLDVLASGWTEVQPTDRVRARVDRLLAVHPLKTADAFQLSAAIAWQKDQAGHPEFVCLDERLADAARREGFRTLPTP